MHDPIALNDAERNARDGQIQHLFRYVGVDGGKIGLFSFGAGWCRARPTGADGQAECHDHAGKQQWPVVRRDFHWLCSKLVELDRMVIEPCRMRNFHGWVLWLEAASVACRISSRPAHVACRLVVFIV